MSSQKGTGGTQSTLLSFFGKPASSSTGAGPSSSSPAASRSRPPLKTPTTARATTSASASAGSSTSKGTGGSKGKETPATSEGDVLTLDDSDAEGEEKEDDKVKVPSKRSAPTSKPKAQVKKEDADAAEQIAGDSDEDEDEEQVARRKRPSLGRGVKARGSMVVDSEDSDAASSTPPKPKASTGGKAAGKKGGAKGKVKGKGKSKGDDDDFSGASSGSDDDSAGYSDASASSASTAVSVASSSSSTGRAPAKKAKAAPAAKAKSAAKQTTFGGFGGIARPGFKSTGSGSGSIKTSAELAREAKKDKQSNEEVFSFLVDPKDADGNRPGEPGYDPRTLYIPKSAWATFTPFERQFWEIKQNHYDTVLFFQKGKFFELYEEDAAIGHREFDLKLTDRVKMKMVGVPESSFDMWASKFLSQGYKVGRVDQCETALGAEIRNKDDKKAGGKGKAKGGAGKQANGKEIVRRELKSVLTTGTIVDGTMLTDDMSSHCVAIKEDTPSPTSPPSFGICVLDASTAEFSLSSFTDDACRTQLETLVRQLKPKELIHQKGNLSVSTIRLLRNCLGLECQWTALKEGKEFLTAENAREEVVKLFKESKSTGEADMEVEGENEGEGEATVPESIRKMYDKPVAMSALGGMVWYLRQLNLDADLVTARNFNIYDPLSKSDGTLHLDGQTLAHIEVLQNSQGGTEGTLIQLLSRCVTPFGKRLFKVWLCAPLRDVKAINDRLDAVEDLLGNATFATSFDVMGKGLPDLERMLSRIHGKTCRKADFNKVIESFESIDASLKTLADIAEDFKSTGIRRLISSAPDLADLLEEIKELYDGEELLPVPGKDDEFDRVAQNVVDVEDSLEEALAAARKSLKCPDIEFKDIGTKDIKQLEVPAGVKVPNNWTKISGTQKVNRYYTPETTRLISDLKEARERKQMVVNDFQFKLYGEFDKHYSTWMAVIRVVAQLDCLLSLSKSSAALGEPCVRPEIIESDTAIVEFEELRHPCVLNTSSDFIPNDVALGGDDAKNLMLLTGPNMAGKSTLLRMTCTAVIMAQLGCFVPAAKARIAPIDAIYSRMGANDFIFANASTFKVEMDDCNKILTKATPRSLVILDELGRGTSTYDGMAIAYAVLHRLATHTGCIGFFATHFTLLTEDYAYHPESVPLPLACEWPSLTSCWVSLSRIRLANMQTSFSDSDDGHDVVFLYKLIDGSAPKSYGPHVAAMAGLPSELVDRAIGISKTFEETSRARELKMRANESLPLAQQADAAFLLKLARLSVAEGNTAQLLRTLATVRKGVEAVKANKAVPASV
ncbi:muts domain V-domain-containing protein [Rhodotorula diobovata]|uniref:DNA mismatch repair protein n=1 Tax=Rhodotorula diobovata TaxID=5288 RepID=A0A5C5FYF8_9BASI|nr:muts domain V-domain-containing protein [Rhodotorula diobovata]